MMKEVCGAISHKVDELTVRKHQVRISAFCIYIYMYIYFVVLSSQKDDYVLASLLPVA